MNFYDEKMFLKADNHDVDDILFFN